MYLAINQLRSLQKSQDHIREFKHDIFVFATSAINVFDECGEACSTEHQTLLNDWLCSIFVLVAWHFMIDKVWIDRSLGDCEAFRCPFHEISRLDFVIIDRVGASQIACSLCVPVPIRRAQRQVRVPCELIND